MNKYKLELSKIGEEGTVLVEIESESLKSAQAIITSVFNGTWASLSVKETVVCGACEGTRLIEGDYCRICNGKGYEDV